MKKFDITEEEFCDILRQLEEANDLKQKIDQLIHDSSLYINNDFMSGYSLSIDHEVIVIKLLELLTHDDNYWISWWCYEKDYGREEDFDARDENDNIIELSTPEHLYRFLLKGYNEHDNSK